MEGLDCTKYSHTIKKWGGVWEGNPNTCAHEMSHSCTLYKKAHSRLWQYFTCAYTGTNSPKLGLFYSHPFSKDREAMPPHLAAFFMKIKINIPAITIEAKPNTNMLGIVYELCMYVAS